MAEEPPLKKKKAEGKHDYEIGLKSYTRVKNAWKNSKSGSQEFYKYLIRRNLGFFKPFDVVHTKTLYSSFCCVKNVAAGGEYGVYNDVQKAIFNIEFSPDNKYLVAACANSDVVLFDPIIQKKLCSVSSAHEEGGANCVTFLDTRTFATCSDDKTIALWDVRNLKLRFLTLKGHCSWVKSINYNAKTKQLISSAFDDTVRTWNVNDNYTDGSVKSEEVLNVPYLTRTKVSPDCSKLVVSTTTGLILVIHDLDLATLKSDTSEELLNLAYNFCPRNQFEKKRRKGRNRIEYLSDFPAESKPWCIASLQMHPFGWNILSRYTSQRANSEWSVVHDIQERSSGVI